MDAGYCESSLVGNAGCIVDSGHPPRNRTVAWTRANYMIGIAPHPTTQLKNCGYCTAIKSDIGLENAGKKPESQ